MFEHQSVLLDEAVQGLHIQPNGIYVDCTLGGAGHSLRMASSLSEHGRLIGIDQDDQALLHARQMIQESNVPGMPQLSLLKKNFRHVNQALDELGITEIDGALYDLGVSSPQLDRPERGFSYMHDAQLDMRMDVEQSLTAEDIVNEYSGQQLTEIIRKYGEERFASRIAWKIIDQRATKRMTTTLQLVDVIKQAIPARNRRTGPHPAKRTFQALRIAVNDELQAFEQSLRVIVPYIKPYGRISVITFHSLEDRICKQFFNEMSLTCLCPPDFPQCVCGQKPLLKRISRKPITPTEIEIEHNPRARSAKLRVAERTTNRKGE